MNNQITSASELQAKIEAKRYGYFTLPTLDITVRFRRPDLLKLSLNQQLPAMMADMIIEGYREMTNGVQPEDFEKAVKERSIKADQEFLGSAVEKGYKLLSTLCVSHKFMDVPDSDFTSEPVPLISWNDVPDNDALAFLFNIINAAQVTETDNGGEISTEEITSFPDGEQVPKRSIVGKSRKAVR